MAPANPILHFCDVRYEVSGRVLVDITRGHGARIAEAPVERSLGQGEVALLVGASGAGKSTLLTVLCGLSLATCGVVSVRGENWAALSESERDQHRSRSIGYLPQREHLIPTLNVIDNVLLPAFLLSRTVSSAVRERANRLLAQLGVERCAVQRPAALSRGESQRVCLARALINAPALLLADEPTANLDDESASRVVTLLAEHAQKHNAALVIATHDMRLPPKVPTAQVWKLYRC